MTLRIPASAYAPTTLRSSAREEATQVRWAMGSRVVSSAMRRVTRTVRSRVDPPAP